MSFVNFIGKRASKTVTFLGDKLEIFKMSMDDVDRIKTMASDANKADDVEKATMQLMMEVIRLCAAGASAITDEQFRSLPIDDLSKLSDEIMKFSGLGNSQEAKKV